MAGVSRKLLKMRSGLLVIAFLEQPNSEVLLGRRQCWVDLQSLGEMFFSCDKFALLDECRSERIQYELVAGQDAQSCAKFLDGFVQATFPDQSQAIFVVSLRIRGGGLRGDMSRKATAQPNEDHDELHCNGAHDQSRLPAESYHRPRLPPGVTQGRFRERFRSNPDLPPIWSLAHIPAQHLRVVPCAGSMYPTLPEPALISILQRGSRHRSVRRTSENRTGNRRGIIYKAPEIFRIPLNLSGSFMYNSYVRD